MRKNLSKINSDFSIQSFEGGYDKNFSYLLTCLETMNSFIIDASIEPNALEPFQKSNPIAILMSIYARLLHFRIDFRWQLQFDPQSSFRTFLCHF